MKNWGVETAPYVVLGGQTNATLRCEHGQVSISGKWAAVDAAVAALTKAEEPPAPAEEPKRILRVVFADGRGGHAAMTFDFPPGHEVTMADIAGLELFASEKVGATVIALSWCWLRVPEAAEAPPTEPPSVLADPPSIGRVAGDEGRKLRAVPPPQGDSETPA